MVPKFGTEVWKSLVKIRIVWPYPYGWPWPLIELVIKHCLIMSLSTPKFPTNWSLELQIWPKMRVGTVKIFIDFGLSNLCRQFYYMINVFRIGNMLYTVNEWPNQMCAFFIFRDLNFDVKFISFPKDTNNYIFNYISNACRYHWERKQNLQLICLLTSCASRKYTKMETLYIEYDNLETCLHYAVVYTIE